MTCCGRICIRRRKINLSTVFAGQNVGIKEVSDKVWLVSFMQYDLGFFDHETGRITSAENPFGAKCYLCARRRVATKSSHRRRLSRCPKMAQWADLGTWRTIIPRAIIRAWKTDFRSPDPSLPYPITLHIADSASEECLAITIGPPPDESRFLFLDNSGAAKMETG